MIFLYIFLGLLALILFLLFVNVHLTFIFDGEAKVFLSVLFIRVNAVKLARSLSEEKPKKKKKNKAPAEGTKKKKAKGTISDFLDFIGLITKIAARAVKDLVSKLKIHLKCLVVRFGTEEADQTALLYGSAIQAANYLFAVLKHFTRFRWNEERLVLAPDFTGQTNEIRCHIVFTIKPIHLLTIALHALVTYQEGKEKKK